MPIHVPGKRDRRNRARSSTKRSVVAVLSLTAMVDMFTVLAVFLLQNYAVTGEVLYISEEVKLPEASAVRDLKPANVVVISDEKISFNENQVVDFKTVKEQQDWMVEPLRKTIEDFIKKAEEEKQSLGSQLKTAVKPTEDGEKPEEEVDGFRRITIQADKKIDFLSVKKIMYTVTEAGIYEINFAVIKRPDEEVTN